MCYCMLRCIIKRTKQIKPYLKNTSISISKALNIKGTKMIPTDPTLYMLYIYISYIFIYIFVYIYYIYIYIYLINLLIYLKNI